MKPQIDETILKGQCCCYKIDESFAHRCVYFSFSRQMVFSVTYSASQWPASAGQVDCPDDMDEVECVQYFK